ncbi:hypothetical protein CRG98_004578 [Punica granatum]|uniref:Uncharacterized protein n=1 Tax=Punica granatum TaxID=22663 RepID=A0A2I0L2U8_PUNGR|nr:hypothetical protein CRG98_004578 [Punica granatum]
MWASLPATNPYLRYCWDDHNLPATSRREVLASEDAPGPRFNREISTLGREVRSVVIS